MAATGFAVIWLRQITIYSHEDDRRTEGNDSQSNDGLRIERHDDPSNQDTA
jgi:hypothetical protein